MIALPEILFVAAIEANMKVPDKHHLTDYNPEEYPHWHCFCLLQLGKPVVFHGEHWDNAKVIASIPENKIKEFTMEDFVEAGFIL